MSNEPCNCGCSTSTAVVEVVEKAEPCGCGCDGGNRDEKSEDHAIR